jgi:hypothetical protein
MTQRLIASMLLSNEHPGLMVSVPRDYELVDTTGSIRR